MNMKILILSDSHGAYPALIQAFEREKPDYVLFLGDGSRDAERLFEKSGATPVCRVSGNCDLMDDQPDTKLLDVAGIRIAMTHGHRFGVKSGLASYAMYAEKVGASVALYGHTHAANCERRGGVLLVNPGAAVNGKYAVLTADGNIEVTFGDIYE